jgi:phosphoserine phosphatase
VPEPERIAVVDNDGTLWCERPAYVQAHFLLDRLREQAAADPALAERPVTRALLAGDLDGARAHGLGELADVLLATHAGLTTEEFATAAAEWLATAPHPRFARPCADLVYAPMLELLDHLRACAFRVFIVTGGGVEFVRAAAERLYGVGPDDVIGSAVEVELERRDGRVVLVRQAKLRGSPNEGAPKVANIQAHVGRRPILAAGNSAGDREMLEYATTGAHRSLGLVVDHDDAEREYAYEGKAMTDPDAEPIADTAARAGWTVVSMRRDWARVFP